MYANDSFYYNVFPFGSVALDYKESTLLFCERVGMCESTRNVVWVLLNKVWHGLLMCITFILNSFNLLTLYFFKYVESTSIIFFYVILKSFLKWFSYQLCDCWPESIFY